MTAAITDALMHFTAMTDHRGDGIPTQWVFDDKTRDAAQVLVAAAKGEREAERAAIVSWLRERAVAYNHGEKVFAGENVGLIANAIERGDHPGGK